MRSASCRWLKPLRSRKDRIECASLRWPRPLEWMLTGSASGTGVIAAISASSSSNDRRQRRQRLLDVRNCTKKQRSHRTTSRESTGVNVVAIQGLRVPERGLLSKPTRRNLLDWACGSQDNSTKKPNAQAREEAWSRENRKETGKKP